MTCETCPFFAPTPSYKAIGTCRFMPPVLFHETGTQGDTWASEHRPEVRAADWCGQHPERRAQAEAAFHAAYTRIVTKLPDSTP